MHHIILPILFAVSLAFSFADAPQVRAADSQDFTDISISNIVVTDDFDRITFDLSRRIPKTEQFTVFVTLSKYGTRLGATRGVPIDGGQHVTLFDLKKMLAGLDYGTYHFGFRACPVSSPYAGSGELSGCGPASGKEIQYMPWHLTSPEWDAATGRMVIEEEKTFTLSAVPNAENLTGEDVELDWVAYLGGAPPHCIRQQSTPPSWLCTATPKQYLHPWTVFLKRADGSQISNAIFLHIAKPETFSRDRFGQFCKIFFVGYENERYTFEVARAGTRERDPLCRPHSFELAGGGKIVEQTAYTVTIQDNSPASFRLSAKHTDALILSRDDANTPLQWLVDCQTLIRQDDRTLTLLRRDPEGKRRPECSFQWPFMTIGEGGPAILARTQDSITVDATTASSFTLVVADPVSHITDANERALSEMFLLQSYQESFTVAPRASMSSSSRPATTVRSAFSDVSASYPYAASIEYVRAKNMVSGYPDGTYRPDAPINRAEFTKIVTLALFGQAMVDRCSTIYPFSDVPRDAWYGKHLCRARDGGLLSGYPDGTFRPAQNINFSEAAKILANGYGLMPNVDVAAHPWYEQYVRALAGAHAIPLSITRFDQPITRGEMAEIIYRLHAKDTGRASMTYASLSSSIAADTLFRSAFFTLSFMLPPSFDVRDEQNSISIAQAPFTDREIGDDNAFFRLRRFTEYDTSESQLALYRRLLVNRTESTIEIDGTTFPTMSGEDWGRFEGTSAGKVLVIFFPKSWLEIIERPANADQTFDPHAVAKEILASMKFSK